MAEEFSVKKYGAYIPVSDQMAMEYGIRPPTEEYLAQKAYWAEQSRIHQEAAMAKLVVALPLLDAIDEPVARLALDLHQRSNLSGRWCCTGCDSEGYEAEQPYWPCRTTRAIAGHYGIELPEDAYDIQRPDDGSLDA